MKRLQVEMREINSKLEEPKIPGDRKQKYY